MYDQSYRDTHTHTPSKVFILCSSHSHFCLHSVAMHTFCGFAMLMTCVTLPELLGGMVLPDGEAICNWMVCKDRTQTAITLCYLSVRASIHIMWQSWTVEEWRNTNLKEDHTFSMTVSVCTCSSDISTNITEITGFLVHARTNLWHTNDVQQNTIQKEKMRLVDFDQVLDEHGCGLLWCRVECSLHVL